MAQIPREQLDRLKDRLDIVELIRSFVGSDLRKKGSRYIAHCPFHDDRTPSFHVVPEQNFYHCFGCQEHGDAVSFVMKQTGMGFVETVKDLAQRAGMELKVGPQSPAEKAKLRARERLYGVLDEAASHYHRLLLEMSQAGGVREYLRSRGITAETVETFQLGYAPRDSILVRHFRKRDVGPELLQRARLVKHGRQRHDWYDFFRGRLIIPIRDTAGRIVGFGGRVINGGENAPKYINSAESQVYNKSRVLYGTSIAGDHIRKSGRAVIVEGYFDVMVPHQEGVKNLVAPCGTSLTTDHAKTLRRYTREVVLLMDPDEAGQRASRRATELLLAAGLDVRLARLPDGLDPDDFVRKHGPEALEQRLADADSAIPVLIDFAASRYDISTPQGKREALDELIPVCAAIRDEVVQMHYYPVLAQRLRLNEDLVLSRLREAMEKQNRSAKRSGSGSYPSGRGSWDGGRQRSRRSTYGSSGSKRRRGGSPSRPFRSRRSRRKRNTFQSRQSGGSRTKQSRRAPISRHEPLEQDLIVALIRHPEFISDALETYPPDQFHSEGLRRVAYLLQTRSSGALGASMLSELQEMGQQELSHAISERLLTSRSKAEDRELVEGSLRALRRVGIKEQLQALSEEIRDLEQGGAAAAPSEANSELRELLEKKSELRDELRELGA